MPLPWMRFFTRDWLIDTELKRCAPLSRSVLVDLMCLASEGCPFGHLADRSGNLTVEYMASVCSATLDQFLQAIDELKQNHRLNMTDNGTLFIPKMVRDEEIREKRAAGGKLGGNPDLIPGNKVNHSPQRENNKGYPYDRKEGYPQIQTEGYPSVETEGYPSIEPEGYPSVETRGYPSNETKGYLLPARVRADSVSVSSSSFEGGAGGNSDLVPTFDQTDLFLEFCTAHPDKSNQDAVFRVWISFDMGYWEQKQAIDCAKRYAESSEVSKAMIMKAPKWMAEQRKNNWGGKWPIATANGNGTMSLVDQVKEQWKLNIAKGKEPL
jgi:hypothetical protein